MTLVVCWKSSEGLSCAADTRLSGSESTISDSGGKLFVIPVNVNVFKNNDFQERLSYSFGFAFAGSTLLANNAHTIASNCTQVFRTESKDNIPSIEIVAEIYSRAAEYVTRDTNSRRIDHIFFSGIIFGFCPIEREFCVYVISHEIDSGAFRVKHEKVDIDHYKVCAIGSGRKEFFRKLAIPNASGKTGPIIDVFYDVLNEGNLSDVGGFPQIMESTRNGVDILPVLMQSRSNPDAGSMTINGFEVDRLGLPEGLTIGHRAMGFGIEKVEGRKALRDKGIDPDSDNFSQGLQNLASIERSLRFAFHHGSTVNLDANYTLSKNNPQDGVWYFSAKCKKCKKSAPLFIDPSDGKMGNPFEGHGFINTHCFRCDSELKKKATGLYSKLWSSR